MVLPPCTRSTTKGTRVPRSGFHRVAGWVRTFIISFLCLLRKCFFFQDRRQLNSTTTVAFRDVVHAEFRGERLRVGFFLAITLRTGRVC